MIKILEKLPHQLTVALSGGVDSIAAADFLSKGREVQCAFFHHGTEQCDPALAIVQEFCSVRNLPLLVGHISKQRPAKASIEEHWRNERYAFLDSLDTTVVTAHTLDDCVETYLHSSMHGCAKVIPYSRNRVVRPFLTTPKREFISWCTRKNIPWYEDASNGDHKFMRNFIRNELVPKALIVNPGLATVVKKIVERRIAQSIDNTVK